MHEHIPLGKRALKEIMGGLPTLGRIVLLAAAYYIVGRLGLLLAIPPGYATVFWPASGIALAAVYVFGYPLLSGVFLGSAALNILNVGDALTPSAFYTGFLIGLGGALQAFTGAWLIRRFVGPASKLERLKEIIGFVMIGGPVSCVIAATCGAGALLLNKMVTPDHSLFVWATWYIGDVLGVIVFSPLLVLLAGSQISAGRKRVVGLPLILLFSLLMGAFIEMKQRDARTAHEEFLRDTDMIVSDLKYSFESISRQMLMFGAFYDSSDSVGEGEFAKFVSRSLLQMPGVLALEWLPHIQGENGRKNFIRQVERGEHRQDFDIMEIVDNQGMRRAGRRDEYFPVLYGEPRKVAAPFIGLDLSSSDMRRRAIERARDEGVPIATERLHLLQEKEPNTYGFLVFVPIYRQHAPVSTVEERRAALTGVVAGAFRFNDITDPFVASWKEEGIETSLVERVGPKNVILYNSERHYRQESSFSDLREKTISLWGHDWKVAMGKLQDYAVAHTDWSIWGALGGGIVFIGFFGVFLLYITGHTAEIEQIVAERTEDLRQARDCATAANNAKTQFLANMSHEIRTPMTAIIGMAQLLEKTETDKEQQHYIETIVSSSGNLLQIIDDILDVSKIEAGKISIEDIPFSLRQVCQDVFQLLQLQAQRKNIGFRLEYAPTDPFFFRGDPLRIRQVLFNLCSNAIKFTDRGEVRVAVTVEDMTEEAASMRLSVTDTGIGISPENQARIFDKFNQADSSTTRKYGGTGLGLSISSSLVQLMGGDISLQSVPGKGSTFSFILDLPRADERELHGASAEGLEISAYKQGRVLLAEDMPANQEIIAAILGSHGLGVDIAENGFVALEKFKTGVYDIIFMDCQMPEMDGYETTKAIRQMPGGDRVPIVAMTAHALKGDRELCLAAGMNDYIPKPIRDAVLESVLARWMPLQKRVAAKPMRTGVDALGGDFRHLNRPVLEELRRIAGDRFATMLEMYMQSAERLIDEAEKSLIREDRDTLVRAAHSLKSASGQVGAEALQELMAEIEATGFRRSLMELTRQLADARLEFREVKSEMRRIH